ncbi:stage VI sporulation protein F [Chengkuizengella axinellae]|uniref:Stage VI sporulation protein F n=1 Tax=Chengkuizengella axinellae TaxID=3064388 RepID=A0ABT9IWS4_9BACL|nr:stage VI sporulation protein F [Chengkuizengella sp. 2205SS18-9]MDP5273785.1 stage VI sporulation protein F [Chengkuizengella sp. 2205SS18-9]
MSKGRKKEKELSNNVLDVVKKKTGKKVNFKDIEKIADGVKPSTLQSEKKLRELIMNVSKMVNVPVSENTINEIIKAVKGSGFNPDQLEQMMHGMMKKKK